MQSRDWVSSERQTKPTGCDQFCLSGRSLEVTSQSSRQASSRAFTQRLPASGGKTGWYPEETLTVEDALKGFTVNPAVGAFLDGQAGVIKEGAWADWVVLDQPLEGLDLEDFRQVTVRETWVGGKLVYQRPGY
jgi:N-acetylglucosamine-6-phosphate deacetylase